MPPYKCPHTYVLLNNIDDDRIYNLFEKRLNDEESEEGWCIANYLAARGNLAALATLNRHYFQYPISSYMWADTVELFGKYRYLPATTNIVDSLDAASLNLSSAASEALRQIFPDSPKNFNGTAAAESYYRRRLGLTEK